MRGGGRYLDHLQTPSFLRGVSLQNEYLFFLSHWGSYSSIWIFTAAVKHITRARALLFTVQCNGQGWTGKQTGDLGYWKMEGVTAVIGKVCSSAAATYVDNPRQLSTQETQDVWVLFYTFIWSQNSLVCSPGQLLALDVQFSYNPSCRI